MSSIRNMRARLIGFAALAGLHQAATAQEPAKAEMLDCTLQESEGFLSRVYERGADGLMFSGKEERAASARASDVDGPLASAFEYAEFVHSFRSGEERWQIHTEDKLGSRLGEEKVYTLEALDGDRVIERLENVALADHHRFLDLKPFLTATRPRVRLSLGDVTQAEFTFKAGLADELQSQARRRERDMDKNLTGEGPVPAGCRVQGEGCFFTTAAVETLGLTDDCWELRQLRAMRRSLLESGSTLEALVARYRREAPLIVSAINRRDDAARIWLLSYWFGVLPSATLSAFGLRSLAVMHYRAFFNWLAHAAA